MGGACSFKPFKTVTFSIFFFFIVTTTSFILTVASTVPDSVKTHSESLSFSSLEGDNGATSTPVNSTEEKVRSVSLTPSTTIIVGVLTATFFLTFLVLVYIKHCYGGNTFTSSPNLQPSDERKNSGIERAIVETLPMFRFQSLRGQKDGLDCAVCLTRFGGPEFLRLLPKCKHAFHVECVDTWLELHSTCPLCRHKVDANDVVLVESAGEEELDVEKGIGNGNDDVGFSEIELHKEEEEVGTTSFKGKTSGDLSHSHRLEHRINVVPQGGVQNVTQRWSDVQPCDVLYLTSEMIMWKARGNDDARNLRSVSEMTGMSRFMSGNDGRERERQHHRRFSSILFRWIPVTHPR